MTTTIQEGLLHNSIRNSAITLTLAVTMLVTACSGDDRDSESTPDQQKPHGYVEGATEQSEPQVSLAFADRGGKRLHFLDPSTEKTTALDLTVDAQRLFEDGRFVYSVDGKNLEVVDSGGWTVDHVDHVHYYRAETKSLGTVRADAAITSVAGGDTVTAVGTDDGTVSVLDRKALEDGSEPTTLQTVETRSTGGFAVPFDDGLVLGLGEDQNRPAVKLIYTDDSGRPRGPEQSCHDPRGWALLRNTAAVSCAEGVALFTKKNAKITARLLEYAPDAPRADDLAFRPRSNQVAAATPQGAWVLESSHDALRWIPSNEPLTAAAAPGRDDTIVTLAGNGTLHTVSSADGGRLATAETPGASAASVLTADSSRAYLSTPESRTIHEIDYSDSLRLARTFSTDVAPELLVEVGR